MKRFESLDLLRGLAALAVVVWHWQHFYDFTAPGFDRSQQPLYLPLLLAYSKGPAAVDLFFCLSGFVFHWLYAEQISRRQISAAEFALRRLSRLYPLHFATLLAVAAAFSIFGAVVYRHDAYHFILNLFLLSSVGLEKGLSYNGPSWSISVEFVLYALFFIGCRWTRSRALLCVLGIVAGVELWFVYEPIARGLISFYAGGAAYLAYRSLPRVSWLPVALIATLCWLVTLSQIYLRLWNVPDMVANAWAFLLLFPITVLSLAQFDSRNKTRVKARRFLGDVSYSIYLLHFPLQVLFMRFALPFSAPWVMCLFFATLLPIAVMSHYYFERPLQNRLRRADRLYATIERAVRGA